MSPHSQMHARTGLLTLPPLPFAENEHHLAAGRLETSLRSKTPPEAVIESLSQLPGQPADQPWTAETRSITLQAFLFVGARSFSHFLNATERYLPLLRALAKTASERMDVLRAVGTFWRSSGQMRVIVGDKLMQYGIVSGEDVVRWVFEEEEGGSREATAEQWMAGQKWDVLRMGVDKVNGRVVGVRRNLVRIEAEEEEKRGGRRAALGTGEGDKEDGAPDAAVPEVDMGRSGASPPLVPVRLTFPWLTHPASVRPLPQRRPRARVRQACRCCRRSSRRRRRSSSPSSRASSRRSCRRSARRRRRPRRAAAWPA